MGASARASARLSLSALRPSRTLRRRLIVAGLAAIALAAAYVLWFRDSSFVAVEDVNVSGIEGAPGLEPRLVAAARQQSTLNVDAAALEAAVADDPAVRAISAEPDFPHGLAVAVDLRQPVGYLRSEGAVVAGDGVVLAEADRPPDGLATLDVKDGDLVRGGAVGGEGLALARVLGAAPKPLLGEVNSITIDPELGVVADLGPGIELRFGSKGEASQKWRATAAVLADRKLDRAAYIDLSVPGRPVVGGLPAGP